MPVLSTPIEARGLRRGVRDRGPGEESMRQDDNEGHQVLLIPFAPGIGDMVMMEPILRALQTQRPEWRLTVVGREYLSDLLQTEDFQLATPFYFVSEAPHALRPLQRLVSQRVIAKAAESAISLDLGPFDQVVNLFWIWESKVRFESWWTPQWPMREGVGHALDLLADHLERELGVEIPPEARLPRLAVFSEAEAWAERYLEKHGLVGCPLVAMVISAENPLKRWDLPKWAELNEWLMRMGWKTILVAPLENEHAREVYEVCPRKPLWPALQLRQVAALLARSDLVVGIDTGPLHMAGALGIPWVGLFGPSNPDFIGPYDRSKGRAIVAQLAKPPSCKNCWLSFKGWGARCPTLAATGCATLIPVGEVTEAILSVCCGTSLASSHDPS